MEHLLLIFHIAATLFMTGVIWTTQLVQYPFFAYSEPEKFTAYHDAYRFWITPVVAPPMLIELFTSFLIIFYKPANIESKLVWLGLALTLTVWASTFFLQIPLHEKLARGFDLGIIKSLVATNWIRTAAWSLRSALVLYFAWKIIPS